VPCSAETPHRRDQRCLLALNVHLNRQIRFLPAREVHGWFACFTGHFFFRKTLAVSFMALMLLSIGSNGCCYGSLTSCQVSDYQFWSGQNRVLGRGVPRLYKWRSWTVSPLVFLDRHDGSWRTSWSTHVKARAIDPLTEICKLFGVHEPQSCPCGGTFSSGEKDNISQVYQGEFAHIVAVTPVSIKITWYLPCSANNPDYRGILFHPCSPVAGFSHCRPADASNGSNQTTMGVGNTEPCD